jgi:hypothetical protein
MKIIATVASTNIDKPKIDSAGVDSGAKIFVGLIEPQITANLSRASGVPTGRPSTQRG